MSFRSISATLCLSSVFYATVFPVLRILVEMNIRNHRYLLFLPKTFISSVSFVFVDFKQKNHRLLSILKQKTRRFLFPIIVLFSSAQILLIHCMFFAQIPPISLFGHVLSGMHFLNSCIFERILSGLLDYGPHPLLPTVPIKKRWYHQKKDNNRHF